MHRNKRTPDLGENPPNLLQHYISIDDRSFSKQQMEAGCLWISSIKCTSNYILKIANILGTRVQLDMRGFSRNLKCRI